MATATEFDSNHILCITPLYGDDERGDEETVTKGEFAAVNADLAEDDPETFRSVVNLEPGATTVIGGGAAGAWEVACATREESRS